MNTVVTTTLSLLGASTACTAVATGASLTTGVVAGALSLTFLFNPLMLICSSSLENRLENLLGDNTEDLAEVICTVALQTLNLYGSFFLSSLLLGMGSFSLAQAGVCSVAFTALLCNEQSGYQSFSSVGKQVDAWIKGTFPPGEVN
jgi:hypothetical protein